MRQRRQALRLSQEAVAEDALSNRDRKGYISNIENGRLKRIRPETARRIAEAVGLAMSDVPASLRWEDGDPESAQRNDVRIAESDLAALLSLAEEAHRLRSVARMVDDALDDIHSRMEISPTEAYAARLKLGLAFIERICGRAFGIRSLGISLTLAYLYVYFAGVFAWAHEGGRVGNLLVFETPVWGVALPASLLPIGAGVLLAVAALLAFRWAQAWPTDVRRLRGRDWLSWKKNFALRLIAAAVLLGTVTFLASLLGADPIAAAVVLAIAGFGALSTQGAWHAMLAGAVAGILAGVVEGLFANQLLMGMIEGSVFGLVAGGVSGYVSGWMAERAPTRGIGGLAGAGTGVAVGALATVMSYMLLDLIGSDSTIATALMDDTFEILFVIWFVLPVVNGLTDFVSLGISHRLGQAALRRAADLPALLWIALLDLLAALGLVILTFVLIHAGLTAADSLLPLDLGPLDFLVHSLNDPFGYGIWLTVMIVSTLFWTAVHYFLVALPSVTAQVTSIWILPHLRARVSDETSYQTLTAAAYLLSHGPVLAFVGLYAVGCLLSATVFMQLATLIITLLSTLAF